MMRRLHTFFLTALALCLFACGGSDDRVSVTGVSLTPSTSLAPGGSITLSANVEPGNATTKDVEWRSAASAVASVDNNGVVRAVAPGTAAIIVRTLDGGRTATCTVTVTNTVQGVTLNKQALSLVKDWGETLTATVLPASAPNRAVTWSSSNPAVASVNANGLVTGNALGSAIVTATTVEGNRTADCAVSVALETVHVEGVGLDRTQLALEVGGAPGLLTVTVTPANASVKTVSWATSNPDVATVTVVGDVATVAGLQYGVAIISATSTSSGRAASCTVRVSGPVPVTGVRLNKATTTLGINVGENLIATILPAAATNQAVTWTSASPAIATVSPAGRVTGVAAGTARITVTTVQGSFAANCDVTVGAATPTTGVSINRQMLMLEIGKTQSLTATVAPAYANNKDVAWTTSDEGVATVSSAGAVTGVSAGTCNVIATVAGFTATCNVAVTTSMSVIASGSAHTMMVKHDGTMWAWGSNTYGQLGDNGPTTGNRTAPVLIAPDHEWVRVSAFVTNSSAIDTYGMLWTWGRNNYSQLGNGEPNSSSNETHVPTRIEGHYEWVDVQQSWNFTLGQKADGTLWICGQDDNYGKFGNGLTSPTVFRTVFQQIGTDSDWAQAACGAGHILAIKTNGTLWAWGYNNNGQIGNGTSGTANNVGTPTMINGETDWVQVACGANFSMALKSDGSLYTWGQASVGQLGNGMQVATPVVSTPTRIAGEWVSVQGGMNHAVALKADGSLWAWGMQNVGQIGNGVANGSQTAGGGVGEPYMIGTDFDWVYATASRATTDGSSSFAIKEDGSVWAWGGNNNGKLGNGNTTNQTRPVRVASMDNE